MPLPPQDAPKAEAELDKVYQLVAYELGSPLASVRTMAELLYADAQASGNENIEMSAKYMLAQTDQLQQKLGNLITWANLRTGNYRFAPSNWPLLPLLQEVWAEQAAAAQKKGVELAAPELDPQLQVQADRAMIKTVVANLLSNAVKFCRKNDRIEVRASVADNKALLLVADTGVGMGPAKLAAIFEPSRKSTQKGTANEGGLGLGMPLVKALLALHQSPLEITSQQGQGTQASFGLPLVS